MKLFELPFDGHLSHEIVRDCGEPFTFRERISNKNYGLGRLTLKDGPSPILKFYSDHNNTVRTHFDWTSKGAIIRMRTQKNQYALALSDGEIKGITLIKTQDYINPTPLMPFWILLKLGVKPSVARRFRISHTEFRHGPIIIEIHLNGVQHLSFKTRGEAWEHCLSTFGNEKAKGRVRVIDQR